MTLSPPITQPYSAAAVDAELLMWVQRASAYKPADANGSQPKSGLAGLREGVSHDAERRRMASEYAASLLPAVIPAGVQFRDIYITLPGREIPVRLYWYADRTKSGKPLPRLMPYFHGGGWMVGSIATHHTLCAHLAAFTDCIVASVHYRRTPENPHPAPHDDCWAAIQWLATNADKLSASPLPLILAGDSAGAHLALGCTFRALQSGKHEPAAMLLFYPPVSPYDAPTTESWRTYSQGPGLTGETMTHYWQALAGTDSVATDPLLYPRNYANPERLPPMVITTAEHDILRDDAEQYAMELQRSGVRVTLTRAPAMLHGFARMLCGSTAAMQHVRTACRQLLDLL